MGFSVGLQVWPTIQVSGDSSVIGPGRPFVTSVCHTGLHRFVWQLCWHGSVAQETVVLGCYICPHTTSIPYLLRGSCLVSRAAHLFTQSHASFATADEP